jgi:hypothetical protein
MPFVDSARKQFTGVVPTGPTTPDVPPHLQGIIDAIEEHVVLYATDWADADTNLAPYTNGMVLVVADPGALYLRLMGVWKKLYPTNLSGTGDPAGDLGDDGDLYFQTT